MKAIKILLCFSLFTFHFSLSAQTWQWAIQDSGKGASGAYICTDSAGNSYITGTIHLYNINFNTCGNFSTGYRYNQSIFVAKYDINGNCVWVNNAIDNVISDVGPSSIAVDKHGNVLLTGIFTDSIYFGSFHIYQPGTFSFVTKYDNNGNVMWVKIYAGNLYGISVDPKCNIYITGVATRSLGGCTLPGGLLITQLDSNGNCIWATGNANNMTVATVIKTDSIGDSYIAGAYWGGTAIIGTYTLTANNNGGMFVAKFDSSGNCLWAKAPWDSAGGGPTSIGIDKWGDVYCIGTNLGAISFGCDTLVVNNSSSYIVKLDKMGNCLWDKLINNSMPYLHVDPQGNCYIAGNQGASASIGTCSLSGTGLFVVQLDSAGNCQWTQTATNAGTEGIDCDWNDNCYIAGGMISTATFGSTSLTDPNSSSSVFVAKLDVASGIDALVKNPNTFNIYPNPSAGGYTLQISANLLNSQLTIYDTQGKLIFQTNITQQNPEINIPSLAKGMYYVKLLTPQGQSMEKSIVQE